MTDAVQTSRKNKAAYLRDYYQQNRAKIREQQRQKYSAGHCFASPELLDHLRQDPRHALGQFPAHVCSQCERLKLKPAVCLECGRMKMGQLDFHLRQAHGFGAAEYKVKWGYSKIVGLLSPVSHKRFVERSTTKERLAHFNRVRRLDHRGLNSASRGDTKAGTPVRNFYWASKVNDWDVARRFLAGMERRQIAQELGVWPGAINRRCAAMHFPSGRAVRYWRGEPFGTRHLLATLRDYSISEQGLAHEINVPVHRIRRAFARHDRPLPYDLADAILRLLPALDEKRRKASSTQRGGRPSQLTSSEEDEIRWKYQVLRAGFTGLGDELEKSTARPTFWACGQLICRLARKRKVQPLVLFWCPEWLTYIEEHAHERAIAKTLETPREIVVPFLAAQYGVSVTKIQHLLPTVPPATKAHDDLRRRRLLLDICVLRDKGHIGAKVHTSSLIASLRLLRSCWSNLTPGILADLLRAFGFRPQTLRIEGRIAKGYQIKAVPIYSSTEAAQKLGVATITLRQRIWKHKISPPPLIVRAGLRGSGRVRMYTESDLVSLRSTISSQPPGAFRIG